MRNGVSEVGLNRRDNGFLNLLAGARFYFGQSSAANSVDSVTRAYERMMGKGFVMIS